MTDELKKAEMAAHAYDGLGTCMSGVDRPQAHASPPFALRSSATLKGIETMSEARKDGGSAFPLLPPTGADGQSAAGYPYPEMGMSLRDWFAGQAIIGLVINSDRNNADDATVAYQVADAMLSERSKAGLPQ